jgi:hypothetical protein
MSEYKGKVDACAGLHMSLYLCWYYLSETRGPLQTGDGWRITNNDELQELMKGEGTVKYITAERVKWWGHLNRMEKTKTVRMITEWDPVGMRSKGRPRNRWKNAVLSNLEKSNFKNWTYLVEDKNSW